MDISNSSLNSNHTSPLISQSNRNSRKSRRWERKQTGFNADKLRIYNRARTQKAQKLKKLRSSTDWERLSLEDKRRQELAVIAEIEDKREKDLREARISWGGSA